MRQVLSAVLLAALVACGGGDTGTNTPPPPPPTPAAVASVSVSLAASSLTAGGTTQATAILRDAGGATLTGRSIQWSSASPQVASVSGSGVVTAVAPGTTSISATSEGVAGSAQLTVTLAPVATVGILPAAPTIQAGAQVTLTATLRDAGGAALTGRDIAWSSSAPTIAVVSAAGVVAGVSAGTATITATAEGRSGIAQVTVTPLPVATVVLIPPAGQLVVGTQGQFAVELRAADNTVLSGRTVTWTSTVPAVANVSGNGVITALSPGVTTIRATSEGVIGSATLTVLAPPPSGFSLTFQNRLINPVDVYLNGFFWRQVGAQASTQEDFAPAAALSVSWTLVRPTIGARALGEPITETFTTVFNPTGGYTATADNVLGNGEVYFTPVLKNLSGVGFLIDMPERFLASRCDCILPNNALTYSGFGYWRLGVLPSIDAYRDSDTFRTGPRDREYVYGFELESGSGVWRKTWYFWP
jgi:uncharacterized protein YjdB